MIAKFLASRFAGPVVVSLLLALAAALGSAFYQSNRVGSLQERIGQQATAITKLESQNFELEGLNMNYRMVIAEQNNAVEALKTAAEKGRTVYLTTYAKADERAKDHDSHAAELLALTNTQTDELAQCRASQLLIEKELGL
jgi:hypothetical protein